MLCAHMMHTKNIATSLNLIKIVFSCDTSLHHFSNAAKPSDFIVNGETFN